MNPSQLTISGPFTHDHLAVFPLGGADAFDGSRFISLDEALEQKSVTIHETGHVGELEAENASEEFDLFIQAGDVVKGGRQDRTLGVDFVLPARSGRVPVPSFCVESGRWHRRAGEAMHAFSSSKAYLSSKKLRLAAKLSRSQSELWEQVSESQAALGASLAKSVHSPISPSSYLLSLEDPDLQARKAGYQATLAKIIETVPDAVGYAFAINGALNTADVYGSGLLFRKLWNKLLDAAIFEAIAESYNKPEPQPQCSESLTVESIRQWFSEAEESKATERNEVPPRVKVETRRSKKTILFETCDHGLSDAVLHRNLVAL